MKRMTDSGEPHGWPYAIRQRRRGLVQRLGLGSATAMIFSPLFGIQFCLIWVMLYFAIQVVDLMVFAPINSGKTERMSPARNVLGGIMLFLNAAMFGSMSIPLWLQGGPMGGVCAAIVLSAGAMYAVVNSPRSARVLAITIAPQFLYLASMPLFMLANGGEATFVTAVAIAIIIFAAYALSTWQRINKALKSEAEARETALARQAETEAMMVGRTAFLAAVGHDLRTPITAILTGSEEMARTGSDPASRANAALISDAGHMMKAMLDDLLDHAKLDAGRMTVEVLDFDLRRLLAQTVRLWQGPVRKKGLKLRIEGARSVPSLARGDAMRLRQILNNLISNALKFTDTGAITLSIKAWPEEPGQYAVLISVIDTGRGMDRAQQDRLFTPFDQTTAGISAQHGGTGLGLTISRDLAELMGGKLTVLSTQGQGSCFTLSLMLEEAREKDMPVSRFGDESRGDFQRELQRRQSVRDLLEAAPAPGMFGQSRSDITDTVIAEPALPAHETPTEENTQDEAQDRPLRVLVVDDHEINRRAITAILTPLGCDMAMACDGLEALNIADQTALDVIFMDVRMPELDGRETTRRLRSGSGPNRDTAVIAVTADTGEDDIAACMDAGMTYFVSKPLTPTTLISALTQVLSGEAQDEAVSEPQAAAASA